MFAGNLRLQIRVNDGILQGLTGLIEIGLKTCSSGKPIPVSAATMAAFRERIASPAAICDMSIVYPFLRHRTVTSGKG